MDPVTLGLIIGVGTQLIGNLFNWFSSQQAESSAKSSADRARSAAEKYLQQLGTPDAAIRSAVRPAAQVVAGQLASAGLARSSIAPTAYGTIASRAVSSIMPAYWGALGQGYRMVQYPEQWLMGMYSGAAQSASQNMGFDLGFLPWLLMMKNPGAAAGGGSAMPTGFTYTPKLW